jgi:hypothetical protein
MLGGRVHAAAQCDELGMIKGEVSYQIAESPARKQ